MAIKQMDKRIEIEAAAMPAVTKFFKDKGRLRRWFEEGYDLCKILDHSRMPVINQVMEVVPRTHFDILDSHDVNTVERTVTKVAAKYEGRIELRTEYLLSSPPKLEGDYTPIISRQDDWEVPTEAVEFMQNSTNVPLCLSMPDFELALKIRETLPGYNPVTQRNEQEIFLPERAICEFVRVGDTVFFIVVNKADRRIRVYPWSKGTSHPATCKVCRAMIRFEKKMPINVVELSIWYAELQQAFGFDIKMMEDLIQEENALAFCLVDPKKRFPIVTEVRAFIEARDTGVTNYISYIDAYASGPTIIDCSMGMPGAAIRNDASHPDFIHKYMVYTNFLWANVRFRSLVGGVPDGMSLEEYKFQLRQAIKPAAVSGTYGAKGQSMCLSVTDHPVYGEDGTAPDMMLHLPTAFQQWKPKNSKKWIDEFVKTFKRHFEVALTKAFPGVATLQAGFQEYWKASVGSDNRGTPPSLFSPCGDYEYKPSILRRNKDVHEGLKYKCPITDTSTSVQRMVLQLNSGIELMANDTHMKDGCILRIGGNRNAKQGIDTLTVHDSEGVHRPNIGAANRNYVHGFNEVLSQCDWKQYGIRCGTFEPMNPDAVLLGR